MTKNDLMFKKLYFARTYLIGIQTLRLSKWSRVFLRGGGVHNVKYLISIFYA